MKKITTAVFAILCISCATVPQKATDVEITAQNKNDALSFALLHFNSCNTGVYSRITTANATPYLVKTLTVAEMKNSCEKINKDCGDIQMLELQEILKDNTGYIYRYKAKYSATTREPEIRVYTNFKHQFDGLIYKPDWLDRYTKFNP